MGGIINAILECGVVCGVCQVGVGEEGGHEEAEEDGGQQVHEEEEDDETEVAVGEDSPVLHQERQHHCRLSPTQGGGERSEVKC